MINTFLLFRLYYLLTSKRGKNVKTERMFLTPSPFWDKVENAVWYKNSPVGINEISKWIKLFAEKIGLDVKRRKISNHSIRSSTVSSLAKAGVGEQQLMKITGHQNLNSIKSYLQLDDEHHESIITKMRRNLTATSNVSCTTSKLVSHTDGINLSDHVTSADDSCIPQGLLQNCKNINFYNCSFNNVSK